MLIQFIYNASITRTTTSTLMEPRKAPEQPITAASMSVPAMVNCLIFSKSM